MQDIIEKLRDDAQYYGEFGKQYLSNSDIGALLGNPKEFGVRRLLRLFTLIVAHAPQRCIRSTAKSMA